MSIKDSIKNLLGIQNNVEVSDPLLRALMQSGGISRENAMKLPAVASAVDLISGTIACIPIKLYEKVETEEGKANKIIEVNDPRVRLVNDDPKDTLDGFQFKKALVEDYLMGKGGYAYIEKRRNNVLSLRYVDERHVSVLSNQQSINKSFEFQIDGEVFQPYEFIKLLRNTKDGASGVSVTGQVGTAIETAYETMRYQLSLVKSGGNKRGFLKSENKLSKEELDMLKDAWKNLYSSAESNAIVLNKGISFQEASSSSTELQLNQSKITLNNEIEAIFHISSDLSTFYREAILPILKAIETALNRDLLLEKEKGRLFWGCDASELIKGTIKERYEAYKTAKETGWLSINEIREKEHEEPIDGMDIITMNLANVIFDINTGTYYTPNTGENVELGKEGTDEG